MQPVQENMARAFIDSLDRPVETRERDDGFNWYVPGSNKIMGFVRFNVLRDNSGHYTIYPNDEFDDPRELFVNEHESHSIAGWRAIVHAINADDLDYVRGILREIIDRQ